MKARNILSLCLSIMMLSVFCIGTSRLYNDDGVKYIDDFATLYVVCDKVQYIEPKVGGVTFIISYDDIYLDSPVYGKMDIDDMTGIYDTSYDVERLKQSNQTLLELNAWAEANGATVFCSGSAIGIGICDYSGWLSSKTDAEIIEKLNSGDNGVYVSDDWELHELYIKDGVFMPQTAALPVLGTYSPESIPSSIFDSNLLMYSITRLPCIYSDIFYVDRAHAKQLTDFFNGQPGLSVARIIDRSQILAIVEQMLRTIDGPGILLTLISLLFAFIYSVMMYYRRLSNEVKIRHHFGLSKRRLFFRSMLIAIGTVLFTLLLVRLYMLTSINSFEADYITPFFFDMITLLPPFVLALHAIGYAILARILRES